MTGLEQDVHDAAFAYGQAKLNGADKVECKRLSAILLQACLNLAEGGKSHFVVAKLPSCGACGRESCCEAGASACAMTCKVRGAA